MPTTKDDHMNSCIVFFDGYCNLCNSSVDFAVRHSSENKLLFASLQSDIAQQMLPEFHVQAIIPKSIVFWERGKVYKESTAVLNLSKFMDNPYPVLRYLKIFPVRFRDWVYRIVARNRYSWFGKRTSCRVPTEQERRVFIG
jgi:predicted DCC family thiol-disulfide oxidoreductase YuxK